MASEDLQVPDDLHQQIEDVRESTRRLLHALDRLGDADARRASLLPGWTRGHVLTHLARNAEGLAAILDGARRGLVVPMYPDGDAGRTRDIEAGAGRDAAALVADLAESAGALDEAWSEMDPAAWSRMVTPRAGRVPAYRLVLYRWIEVEVHRVDLDLDYGPESWPERFVPALLSNLVERGLASRLPAGITLELGPDGTDPEWTVGSGPRRVRVSGPSWAYACWLVGRTAPARDALTGDLPALAPFG